MKHFTRVVMLSLCVSVLGKPGVMEYSLEDADQLFQQFIVKYEKQYQHEQEKQKRYEIFKDNLLYINNKNKESDSAVFGITKFLDLSREEFKTMYTGAIPNIQDGFCTAITDDGVPDVNAPDSWDWRQHNVVSAVKDQQSCSSCYAFSSTGHIESQYAMKYTQSIIVSEQQIVDCDTIDTGCGGGWPASVFRWLIDNGGIEAEYDYPYVGSPDTCKFDNTKAAVKLTQCYSYQLSTQEKVKQLLYKKGPLSIVIDATNLQYWDSSTVFSNCGDALDHAVLLVGYGTEGNQPYWIVKNSWGSNWGEQGYFRMIRGGGTDSCGMMMPGNIMSVDVQ